MRAKKAVRELDYAASNFLNVDGNFNPVLASRVFVWVDLAFSVCTGPVVHPCKSGMDMQSMVKIIQ